MSAAYEERRNVPVAKEWPASGTYLDSAIRESERIVKILDEMYQDIETLKGPEEIFQELDNDDVMENQDERGQKSPTDGVMGQGMPLEMPPGVINEADRIMLDDKGNALNVKTE